MNFLISNTQYVRYMSRHTVSALVSYVDKDECLVTLRFEAVGSSFLDCLMYLKEQVPAALNTKQVIDAIHDKITQG